MVMMMMIEGGKFGQCPTERSFFSVILGFLGFFFEGQDLMMMMMIEGGKFGQCLDRVPI